MSVTESRRDSSTLELAGKPSVLHMKVRVYKSCRFTALVKECLTHQISPGLGLYRVNFREKGKFFFSIISSRYQVNKRGIKL